MGEIIIKSRIAAALPPLDNEELAIAIQAWAEIFYGEVPESDLSAAYLRAMRDKDSSFALNASDVVRAFRANCESERAAPRMPERTNLLSEQSRWKRPIDRINPPPLYDYIIERGYPNGIEAVCPRCGVKRNASTTEAVEWMSKGFPCCKNCGIKITIEPS